MSDANAIAGAVVRACKACGLNPRLPKQATCKSCYRRVRPSRHGQYAKLSAAQRRAQNSRITRHRRKRRNADGEYRNQVNAGKRARRAAAAARKGRTLRFGARDIEALHDRQTVRNAREAWQYFIRVRATDRWMRAYYEESGKPWRNPRLTDAERYKLRYALDEAFAQRERERTSERRFRIPAYAQQWAKDGTRWYRAAQSDDGSITPELLKALRAETHCAYCHRFTAKRDRHIDHVWPLAKDGAHSADNLVMACGMCNRAKRDALPLAWLQRITNPRMGYPNEGWRATCPVDKSVDNLGPWRASRLPRLPAALGNS